MSDWIQPALDVQVVISHGRSYNFHKSRYNIVVTSIERSLTTLPL